MSPRFASGARVPTSSLSHRLQPLVSPAVFDFWAARVNPAWSWDRPMARVVSRRIESRDAVTLVLKPNRHFGGFRAGQHVNVTAEVDGARITRSYSPSAEPRVDGRVEITVRHVEGGKLSTQLCLHTKLGDVVELGPAFGEMTWPANVAGRWLFLAAGSGITPLMSLIRSAPSDADIDLVYWARRRSELCFADELRTLATRHRNLRCHFVLTREAQLEPGEPHRRPDAELLQTLVPDLAACRSYSCGPSGFVASTRALLEHRVAHFQAEAFTPAAPSSTVRGSVRVELVRSARTLELPAGESLLSALEAQGLRPPHGCRMGLCNTCACEKLSGTTQHLLSGDSDAEPASALRLCVNRAVTDLRLDL